jgi:hypothetical protein
MKNGKYEAEDFKQFGEDIADSIAACANNHVLGAPIVGMKTGYMGGWVEYRPDMFHYSHIAYLVGIRVIPKAEGK